MSHSENVASVVIWDDEWGSLRNRVFGAGLHLRHLANTVER